MRVYRERLGVPAWWWLAATILILLIGTMLWLGLSLVFAVLVYVVFGGLTTAALSALGKALIEVTDTEIVVAGRRLPLAEAGEVSALDVAQTRELRFARADPAAYLLARPYLPRSVYIEVAGRPADCPYWLIGTRRPAAFAAAIEQARSRTGRGGAWDDAGSSRGSDGGQDERPGPTGAARLGKDSNAS
jgi:hypothetical protein